jgi:hypothetical protein
LGSKKEKGTGILWKENTSVFVIFDKPALELQGSIIQISA